LYVIFCDRVKPDWQNKRLLRLLCCFTGRFGKISAGKSAMFWDNKNHPAVAALIYQPGYQPATGIPHGRIYT